MKNDSVELEFPWDELELGNSPNCPKTGNFVWEIHYLNQDPYDPRFAPTYLTKARKRQSC